MARPWGADHRALKMVPLTEPIRPLASGYPSAYPRNLYGESFHTIMANQITWLVQRASGKDYITVHTVVGEAGQGMSAIKKGAVETGNTGRAYQVSLFEAHAITRLAITAQKTYGIRAIVMTHGETDANNFSYENELYQLWTDYNTDLLLITGQKQKIPMLVSQQHALPNMKDHRSSSTLAQWHIGLRYPGDILCTGPKYQYEYVHDGIHLTARGYHQLGEKLGQIYYNKVILGKDWQPLQPMNVRRNDNVITIQFHVSVPPLRWDYTLPAPHQKDLTEWSQGRGFEVRVGGKRVTINSVEIKNDTVQITCAENLNGKEAVVGYAMTTDGTAPRGRTFRSGQLCDSDNFVGLATQAVQPNYCVAFELPVPFE